MVRVLLDLTKLQGPDFWHLQASAMVAFFCLCVLEGLITRRPISQEPPAELVTDMFYWIALPAVRMGTRVVLAGLLALLMGSFTLRAAPDAFNGFGPIARQPKLALIAELLVLMDLSSYWVHRLFHSVPFLWRFHAIHHSATDIRWSTTGRVHPLNELVNYLFAIVPCFLLGFPISVVLPLMPVMVVYAVAAHTQWNLSFGPLGVVLASPRFHRWHHTLSHEGGNKNFCNVFAFWDLVFGTYYLPSDRLPQVFGLDSDRVPESYLGQLAFPFRRPSPAATAAGALPGPAQGAARQADPAGAARVVGEPRRQTARASHAPEATAGFGQDPASD